MEVHGNPDFFFRHLRGLKIIPIKKEKKAKPLTYIPLCVFELDRKARSHHESPGVLQSVPVVMAPTCHLTGTEGRKVGSVRITDG